MASPRLMLCGVMSGSGKTTVTCGLLQTLVNRGLRTAAFKCGPDYIDPMMASSPVRSASGISWPGSRRGWIFPFWRG